MRMIAARIGRFFVTFLAVTFLTTVLLSLVPGDPAVAIAGPGASQEVIDALNEEYSFNEPVIVRYANWLTDALQGDLGVSYRTGQSVSENIKVRLPVTLELAVLATLLSLIISVPLAMASARRAGSRFDRGVSSLTYAQISVPNFVVALFLIYIFGVWLEWLPILGFERLSDGIVANLKTVALPVVSIAMVETAALQRVLRADLIETTKEDYIMLARAKGLPTRTIMWKHAFKPSSFSLMTLSALSLARLMGGTVIVESIFVLPGLGTYLLGAILGKDLVVVQGVVAFIAVVFLLVNLIVDLAYGVLDPRIRAKAAT